MNSGREPHGKNVSGREQASAKVGNEYSRNGKESHVSGAEGGRGAPWEPGLESVLQ